MNYTLSNDQYTLSAIKLDYFVENGTFPNASISELGNHTAEMTNLTVSSTSKGSSYKCSSHTLVSLSKEVSLDFSNYQAQAFMSSSKKSKDFDIATSCPADITGQSKLVPIIVGSCLAALVFLVLIAYIVGRRRHLPGYQQVWEWQMSVFFFLQIFPCFDWIFERWTIKKRTQKRKTLFFIATYIIYS